MARLSQYFTGIAAKRLSAVEVDPQTSNQHEFNGIRAMAHTFGTDRKTFDCTYIYFGDDEDKTTTADGFLTWYDARENHATRTEYRLYFQGNTVMELANPGDLLVIGKRPNERAMALVVKKDTTIERQILWLFGIEDDGTRFTISDIEGNANRQIGYAERTILETLGIETETEEAVQWIDRLVEEFDAKFPSTSIFSEYARLTVEGVSPLDDPDGALMAWINHEEMLFRTLERHIVQQRLDTGFKDVDDFVEFSLSVQNRRKSRVGFALENHLAKVFMIHGLTFSQGKVTENKAKPDFVFPGIAQYHQPQFPADRLTMLGSKSTCKDRWRQVLSEAGRISNKHLFTLEPGISVSQTDEMRAHQLQLVLPEELHGSYLDNQQDWLMNLREFIALVWERQQF